MARKSGFPILTVGLFSSWLLANHGLAQTVTAPYTIGVALAQTSNVAMLGQEQVFGVRLAEQYFNGKGGIGGQKLQILLEDSAGDESSAINVFNLLIRKKVLAIVGPSLSQQAFAADPIADRAKVPVIAPSNTADGIPQIGRFVTRVSAPVGKVAPNAIQAALKAHPDLRKVAVLFAQNDAFSSSEAKTFQDTVKANPKLSLISVQKFQTTDTDFTSQVSEVLKLKPDLVIISGLAADGGNLVKQLRQLGFKGQVIGGNGLNTPNVFPVCQKFCEGVLVAQAYSPEATEPMNKAFVQLYQQQYKRLPGQFAAQAFTSVQVLVEALVEIDKKKKLSTYDLKALRQELNAQLQSQSYDTPLGPLRFDKDGDVVQTHFYVAQIKMDADGKSGRFAFPK